MIDLAAVEKKQAAADKRQAAANKGRDSYIAAMTAVKAKFNAAFNYDMTTELGIAMLNRSVYQQTGMNLVQHTESMLKQA